MFEELITKRCKIRRFKPSDADGLFEVLSDSDVMRFVEPPFTYAQTCDFVERCGLCDNPKIFALIMDKSKFSNTSLCSPSKNGISQNAESIAGSPYATHNASETATLGDEELIGHVIFHPFYDERLESEYGKDGVYELGFILSKAYWNMGIATEIATSLVEYSRKAGISALVLECAPDNVASRKLANRLGFSLFSEPNATKDLDSRQNLSDNPLLTYVLLL